LFNSEKWEEDEPGVITKPKPKVTPDTKPKPSPLSPGKPVVKPKPKAKVNEDFYQEPKKRELTNEDLEKEVLNFLKEQGCLEGEYSVWVHHDKQVMITDEFSKPERKKKENNNDDQI